MRRIARAALAALLIGLLSAPAYATHADWHFDQADERTLLPPLIYDPPGAHSSDWLRDLWQRQELDRLRREQELLRAEQERLRLERWQQELQDIY